MTPGGGQQTAQQIELTAYAFTPITGTAGSTTCDANTSMTPPCLTISVKNTGGSAITVGNIYFDELALTLNAVLVATPITIASHGNAVVLLTNAGSFTGAHGGYTGMPS